MPHPGGMGGHSGVGNRKALAMLLRCGELEGNIKDLFCYDKSTDSPIFSVRPVHVRQRQCQRDKGRVRTHQAFKDWARCTGVMVVLILVLILPRSLNLS